MNSSNIKAAAVKSQSSVVAEKLTKLYRQMSASDFDADHPWLLSLAEVISEEEEVARMDNATDSASATIAASGPESLHKRFSWLQAGSARDGSVERSATAMDALYGIATCLELIEMSNLDRELADPDNPNRVLPVLSMCDTGRLMRLAILVAREWGEKFEDRVSKHNRSQQ